jgi:hypothetical protein
LPLVLSGSGGAVVDGGAGDDVVGGVGGRVAVVGDETGADGELEHAASDSANTASKQTAATRCRRRRARVAVGLESFVPCTSEAFSGGMSIV